MNKKIKLLSLISTPILLGGGFAALTLVNQCSNKPEVRVYNLNDYINENISSYFSGGSMIPGADNVLDAAYALSKNGFRNLVSRDEFGENVEFTYFSYTLKNCTLVPIEGSTLFIGTVSLT
jgi:spermidine/putrescine-binding protein